MKHIFHNFSSPLAIQFSAFRGHLIEPLKSESQYIQILEV